METIQSCYIAVAGSPIPCREHALQCFLAAVRVRDSGERVGRGEYEGKQRGWGAVGDGVREKDREKARGGLPRSNPSHPYPHLALFSRDPQGAGPK